MDKNDIASKRQDEEDGNNVLVDALNSILNLEMEKTPDKINVKKVDYAIKLLNILQNRSDDVEEISKEEFAKRFLTECNLTFGRNGDIKRIILSRKLNILIGYCTWLLIVGVSNYIAVRAINKNIFTFLKENARIFIMMFLAKV